MQEEHEGSSYLAALKRSAGGGASAAAPARIAPAGATPAGGSKPSGAEKRRSPRYRCEGSAEIRAEGADVRTWAACTDISMHGCYLEASTVYPVDTKLLMKIDAQGLRIQAQGNVRVSYPHLGMGVAFMHVAQADRNRLKEMLRTIALPSVIMGTVASVSDLEPMPNISDPSAALSALTEFFEGRQMLTRGEFIRLLHKSQAAGNGTRR
jgi:PilZ domain-containing protein